jgi:hypothetical protein
MPTDQNHGKPDQAKPVQARPIRDRVPRLRNWAQAENGSVWAARCLDCGHVAALPVALLLHRYGALTPIELVRDRLTCSACKSRVIEVRLMGLCDPGCPRQRG